VHQVRTLVDLVKAGHHAPPAWMAMMVRRRRKTLIVCRNCHTGIHGGSLPHPTGSHGAVTGEPGDRKRLHRVRDGDAAKGPKVCLARVLPRPNSGSTSAKAGTQPKQIASPPRKSPTAPTGKREVMTWTSGGTGRTR
jgi:hypothetical protein